MKGSFLTCSVNLSVKTVCFFPINPGSGKLIYVSINFVYSTWNFDAFPSLEMPFEFLDMPKDFGRFFMKGLTYKLKTIGVLHNLLVQSFLGNRYQRVLLNGQNSQ